MKQIIGIGLVAALAACSQQQNAAITSGAAQVTEVAQNIVADYGIAKGIAQVAEVADPGLVPSVNAVLAKTDPIIGQLEALSTQVSPDVAAVEALVAQAQLQLQGLRLLTAPKVTVIPNQPAKS